jgi:hypothetical protein
MVYDNKIRFCINRVRYCHLSIYTIYLRQLIPFRTCVSQGVLICLGMKLDLYLKSIVFFETMGSNSGSLLDINKFFFGCCVFFSPCFIKVSGTKVY